MRQVLLTAVVVLLFLVATLRAEVAGTRPVTTRPIVDPITRPATTRADPLAQPDTAVEHLFTLIREEKYDEIREMSFEPTTVGQIKRMFERTARSMKAGMKPMILDLKQSGNISAVLCRTVGSPRDQFFGFIMIKRFDRWKFEAGNVNPRRVTATELAHVEKIVDWSAARLPQLRDSNAMQRTPASTTQASTAPATTAAAATTQPSP